MTLARHVCVPHDMFDMLARYNFFFCAQVFDVVGNILSRGEQTRISWSTFCLYRVQHVHIVGNQKNGIVGNILSYRGEQPTCRGKQRMYPRYIEIRHTICQFVVHDMYPRYQNWSRGYISWNDILGA